MTHPVFRVVSAFGEDVDRRPKEYVDQWLDCLALLYQVSLWVEPVRTGVFRYVVRGFTVLETLRPFLDQRHFPYMLQTTLVHDYEIIVDVFRLIYTLNDGVNFGLRKTVDD